MGKYTAGRRCPHHQREGGRTVIDNTVAQGDRDVTLIDLAHRYCVSLRMASNKRRDVDRNLGALLPAPGAEIWSIS